MAIYIPSSKLLFIQTPGTGSTSIESALLKLEDALEIGNKHDGLTEIKPYLLNEFSNITSICFVRNPFDWYVSEWWRLRKTFVWDLLEPNSFYSNDKFKKKEIVSACAYDFPKWIEFMLIDMYERNLEPRTCVFESWTNNVSYVHKFENIDTFSDLLNNEFDIKIDIPCQNVGGRTAPYWTFYTAASRNLLQDICSITLEKYGYVF